MLPVLNHALQGAWANAHTLEECRDELQSALEDWLVLGLRLGHSIPALSGIDLTAPVVAAPAEDAAV